MKWLIIQWMILMENQQFNAAVGDVLKSILDDAMEKQDYVLGQKQ